MLLLNSTNLLTSRISGGGGEIRTHGRLSPSLVFKTSALNHSATPPAGLDEERRLYGENDAWGSLVLLFISTLRANYTQVASSTSMIADKLGLIA